MSSDTRKMNIDLGLVLHVSVPSTMSDQEVLDHIFRASCGEGDSRQGVNMLADMSFYVASQIGDNLKNIGSPVETQGSGIQPKPKGDTRSPRQRFLDYQSKPEFTQGNN
tara:strand:- start:1259 stop:1585 length:327 start_codon:yes stop_codon:yes gene_type:complete